LDSRRASPRRSIVKETPMPKFRDPVQQALRAIQAEIDHVLDHHGSGAAQRELGDALVELGVGLGAARPARPPMSLADIAGRPEPESAVEEATPEDNSQAAVLLAKLGA
jgi:hypothetical protein